MLGVCVLQKNQPAAVHAERGGEDSVETSVRLAFLPTCRRHQALPLSKSLHWLLSTTHSFYHHSRVHKLPWFSSFSRFSSRRETIRNSGRLGFTHFKKGEATDNLKNYRLIHCQPGKKRFHLESFIQVHLGFMNGKSINDNINQLLEIIVFKNLEKFYCQGIKLPMIGLDVQIAALFPLWTFHNWITFCIMYVFVCKIIKKQYIWKEVWS